MQMNQSKPRVIIKKRMFWSRRNPWADCMKMPFLTYCNLKGYLCLCNYFFFFFLARYPWGAHDWGLHTVLHGMFRPEQPVIMPCQLRLVQVAAPWVLASYTLFLFILRTSPHLYSSCLTTQSLCEATHEWPEDKPKTGMWQYIFRWPNGEHCGALRLGAPLCQLGLEGVTACYCFFTQAASCCSTACFIDEGSILLPV